MCFLRHRRDVYVYDCRRLRICARNILCSIVWVYAISSIWFVILTSLMVRCTNSELNFCFSFLTNYSFTNFECTCNIFDFEKFWYNIQSITSIKEVVIPSLWFTRQRINKYVPRTHILFRLRLDLLDLICGCWRWYVNFLVSSGVSSNSAHTTVPPAPPAPIAVSPTISVPTPTPSISISPTTTIPVVPPMPMAPSPSITTPIPTPTTPPAPPVTSTNPLITFSNNLYCFLLTFNLYSLLSLNLSRPTINIWF